MAQLVQQLVALRTPPDIKTKEAADQWDEHLQSTLLPFLDGLTAKQLLSISTSDSFSSLNVAADTLPCLYVLHEQIHAASAKSKGAPSPLLAPGGEIMDSTVHFIMESNDIEVRYGGAKIRQLIEYMASVAHLGGPKQSEMLMVVVALMLKVDYKLGTLTSSHLVFLRCCMELRQYSEARRILDNKDIHSLPAKESSCSPLQAYRADLLSNAYLTRDSKLTLSITRADVLEFYLLGAMTYIALKQWHRAMYFLEHVLATPTSHTANGSMLEAYKKWVLVGLLARGKAATNPRLINTTALRTIRSVARPYDALADAFKLEDGRKLSAEIHEAWPILLEDGNSGLASDVYSYHRMLSVSKLAQIYVAVPLSRVAQQLGISQAEAEEYLSLLITQSLLNASIERPAGGAEHKVLRFSQPGRESAHGADELKSETRLRQELIDQTSRITSLQQSVEEADRRMALTKEYLEYTRKARRSKEEQGEGGMEEGDGSFGGRIPSDDEDENVMADVR